MRKRALAASVHATAPGRWEGWTMQGPISTVTLPPGDSRLDWRFGVLNICMHAYWTCGLGGPAANVDASFSFSKKHFLI